MKKFYSFLSMILCTVCAFADYSTENIPVTFCIYVEDASVCYATDSNGQNVALKDGENVFELIYHATYNNGDFQYGYSDEFYFKVKDNLVEDYEISGCNVEINGELIPYDRFYSPTTSLYIYVTDAMDSCVFYPTIINKNDARTAKATVNIDDASKVMIRCGSYVPTLIDGTNDIYFNPSTESNWQIGAKNYGQYLGGVTHNGSDVESNYGTYYITVSPGDVIDITASATLSTYSVNFTGNTAAIKNVYSYINYSESPIANWSNGFDVDDHSQIIVELDTDNYNVTDFSVNGSSQYLYSNRVYLTIESNTTVSVTATQYSTYNITLKITDPDHVLVQAMASEYSGGTTISNLIAGTQTLTLSEQINYMSVSANEGCIIVSVQYQGVDDSDPIDVTEGYSGYTFPVSAGTVVTVVSKAKERNDRATFYVHDLNKFSYISFQRADYSDIFQLSSYTDVPDDQKITTDTHMPFYFDAETENPIKLYLSPSAPAAYDYEGYVTVNGEQVKPKYAGSPSYEFSLKNGDSVHVYETKPTSGIEDVAIDAESAETYDLFGRKVEGNLAPGLYIRGGKKVLVK